MRAAAQPIDYIRGNSSLITSMNIATYSLTTSSCRSATLVVPPSHPKLIGRIRGPQPRCTVMIVQAVVMVAIGGFGGYRWICEIVEA